MKKETSVKIQKHWETLRFATEYLTRIESNLEATTKDPVFSRFMDLIADFENQFLNLHTDFYARAFKSIEEFGIQPLVKLTKLYFWPISPVLTPGFSRADPRFEFA